VIAATNRDLPQGTLDTLLTPIGDRPAPTVRKYAVRVNSLEPCSPRLRRAHSF
jgi:hypothetical protein